MSQNFETCYSTISNMRAYGQICYNFFDYFIYFSLSVCNTAFSLSPHWSPSLRCSLFLSHFHFFYLSLSSSLFFITFLSLSLSYFFSSFFHCLFLAPVTPSSLFLILSSPASSQWLRVLFLFFFSCHYLSLFLFLSRRRRRF